MLIISGRPSGSAHSGRQSPQPLCGLGPYIRHGTDLTRGPLRDVVHVAVHTRIVVPAETKHRRLRPHVTLPTVTSTGHLHRGGGGQRSWIPRHGPVTLAVILQISVTLSGWRRSHSPLEFLDPTDKSSWRCPCTYYDHHCSHFNSHLPRELDKWHGFSSDVLPVTQPTVSVKCNTK